MARSNPVAFTPGPVTLITTAVYLALIIPLLIVHFSVPSPPSEKLEGLDISEAWQDLLHLTEGYHPYNSRKNDEVHTWLLDRINTTLSNVAHSVRSQDYIGEKGSPEVFVFDDQASNLSFAGEGIGGKFPVSGVYFESTNIIVYIRGTDDDQTNWWEEEDGKPSGKGGVLVNAHYDSVSTGYGATDDGVGVVTLLQLLKYFTTPGHHPRKGVVLLFNNGEEDFLNGANVFTQHPFSQFAHSFVNLEGAGAGGRAVLFRSTDTEVTRFYKGAPHPFGSAIGNDGFNMGLIRSETDYAVFAPILGLRGLDIAFYEPRSRYHTHQDDAKHTSPDSVWHMVSSAVKATEALSSYDGDEFDKQSEDGDSTFPGSGSTGVWFDIFGYIFMVMKAHTLFALSVTLLVCGPVALALTAISLSKSDKMYMFANTKAIGPGNEWVQLRGFRGLFRVPIIFVVTSAGPIGLAYLIEKVNPYISHGSPYMVWTMMISLWVFLSWFFSRVSDFSRPSALHRAYGFTWLSIFSWILLVISTVKVNQNQVVSGYFILFYFAGSFLATWISYLELFALPKKLEYAAYQLAQDGGAYPTLRPRSASVQYLIPSPGELGSEYGENSGDEVDEDDEITESTSLLTNNRSRPTFANYTRTTIERVPQIRNPLGNNKNDSTHEKMSAFGEEQAWSANLPRWTWVLQLLVFAPVVVVLVGQLGLLVTGAIGQIGQDGAPTFTCYFLIALCVIFTLSPTLPLMHRFTYHIPMAMLFVFVVTLWLNLVMFPLNSESKLKVFFAQNVNLESQPGDVQNQVTLTGIQPYVKDAISHLPSSIGKEITCGPDGRGRDSCTWEGIMPDVVGDSSANISDWLSYTITRPSRNEAKFQITGRNTRACKLYFNTPVQDWSVAGSAYDPRQPHTSPGSGGGIQEIRLWSREWEHTWDVSVRWDSRKVLPAPAKRGIINSSNSTAESPDEDWSESIGGKVICEWADLNQAGAVPAFEELRKYLPTWAIATKLRDGLVEGYKKF
ncbi:Peptidase M28 [Ascosphaera apis ARSEF 7405]|uniref:Peptide hydrolase n=1 Tax=Ascosphaera apis ARSEF 7405 TaxID=392613 RepID=A0A168AWM7_9EURO|nr:Peptidase M28 [Ascosphaera apis ARSEF 7405]